MICTRTSSPPRPSPVCRQEPAEPASNITNDAWFGATSEPYEHLALAVYRAVEHRTELVRAVNTGVSAYIDATGRIGAEGPLGRSDADPDVQPVALLQDMASCRPAACISDSARPPAAAGCARASFLFGLAGAAACRSGAAAGPDWRRLLKTRCC